MTLLKQSVAAVTLALASGMAMAECGDIVVAEMDWASAEFAANLDKIILEEGYGCSVDLAPGATATTLASMESKGRPHIAPEFWSNAVRERLQTAEENGQVIVATKLIADAADGWYVSKSIADDYPEINSIDDVLAHPELFPNKENPGKGTFVNCPSGWTCQIANTNLTKPSAYNFEKAGFIALDPGSAAGLDGTIAKSYDREEGWFGYYWQPSSVLSKYELKRLTTDAEINDDHWNSCIAKEECDTPERTNFTPTTVNTIVTTGFAGENPDVMEYINKRAYTSDEVGKVLVYMSDNQADGADGAIYFLEKHEEIWTKWVSPEVAEKVRLAIN